MNKDNHDNETQTHGICVEQLENSLSYISNENSFLYVELDSSNKTIESLKRDLEIKKDELKTISEQNLNLNSKVEILMGTIEEAEKNDAATFKRIENLCEEKNKFKYDFIEVSRERDEAAEQIIVLKNK